MNAILAVDNLWSLGILLILGYPLLAVLLFEASRLLGAQSGMVGNVIRQVQTVLLPSAAIWLVVSVLADLPPEHLAVRAALTVLAIAALFLVLTVVQGLLVALLEKRQGTPKLLLDILRIMLALLGAAIIVSAIWHVNLGSLIAAMGVGSVVLGLALQEVLGNFVSGLALLYDHKFALGDWILIDGKVARVIEMDWRSVTLGLANGDRVIVANSTLAKTTLTIAARKGEARWTDVALEFGLDVPPEQVREAVLEAGRALPGVVYEATQGVRCVVTGYSPNSVLYSVKLRVADPSVLSAPRNELLSRLWYVAQRRGLRLGFPTLSELAPARVEAGAAERRAQLEATGLFHNDAALLDKLAEASSYQRFRAGDVMLSEGTVAASIFVVLSGAIRAVFPSGEGEWQLERVGSGQVFITFETINNAPSPVRLVAEENADVLAIHPSVFNAILRDHPTVARDVGTMMEARRQALALMQKDARRIA